MKRETPVGGLLQALLSGTHQTDFSYKAINLALEETAKINKAYGLLLKHKPTLEFVVEWHTGIFRNGEARLPYIQHVLQIVCTAIGNNAPEPVILACLLKSIAQRSATLSMMTKDDYDANLLLLNNPQAERILDKLAEISNHALAVGIPAKMHHRTWNKRSDEKVLFLESLIPFPEPLLCQFFNAYDYLKGDIKDLKENGNQHWNHFNANPGKQINYFKRCLVPYKTLKTKYSFMPDLLKDFEDQLELLRELNKKPAKVTDELYA